MKTLQEIEKTLSNHKSRLFHDYPIKSMAIFGSYSRSEQNDLRCNEISFLRQTAGINR